ncbi:MAG: hypothetical protein MRZ59_09325 [Clostridiales bacterium]|nr:hypothetical protein [Clostridiales bacterium]MDY3746929.1 hypothetical protein [Lachnospiraceae bacterium]
MNSENKTLEILALVIGIASLPLSCLWAIGGVLAGALGLVIAMRGRRRNKSSLLSAAMICSILGIVIGVSSMVIMIAFYIMAVS